MNKYEQYYKYVEQNKRIFDSYIKMIEISKRKKEKLKYARKALIFATCKNAGIFTSSYLENFFTDCAKSLPFKDYDVKFKPNSFLHVLTQGYNTGGHTRVVERWIFNAPDNQTHSVIFIDQEEKMPVLEKNTKEKNGECFYLDTNKSLEEKALELRKTALKYEYIILHTHMEDPCATIAFGVSEFTRPVIFYNHASHMFWIGKAISDIVAQIPEYDPITSINRKIENPYSIGIPIDVKTQDVRSKNEYRKKLNLPIDKKIIISTGHANKYIPILDDNFPKIVKEIIDEDTYCYVIGPSKKDKLWSDVYNETNGHIDALGYVKFEDGFLDYIKAADLYLDSLPMHGWTASIDAISSKTPVLTYETDVIQLDYLRQTDGLCQTKEEFIQKARKVLDNKDYAKELIEAQIASLKKHQSKEVWLNKVEKLIEKTPKKHCTKILNEEDYSKPIDTCVSDNFLCNNKNFAVEFDKKTLTLFDRADFFIKMKMNFLAKLYLYKLLKSKGR